MEWTAVSMGLRLAGHCHTPSMASEAADPNAHVVFQLSDEDGWPPVGTERLWAFRLGGNQYRIDNVPFFVCDLAVGDVVRTGLSVGGSDPVFSELVERSDHVTIRLICFEHGPLQGDVERALELFTVLGVFGEGFPEYRMLALDIEPTAPLPAIVETLRRGVDNGSWDYEEGRITQAWIDARAD